MCNTQRADSMHDLIMYMHTRSANCANAIDTRSFLCSSSASWMTMAKRPVEMRFKGLTGLMGWVWTCKCKSGLTRPHRACKVHVLISSRSSPSQRFLLLEALWRSSSTSNGWRTWTSRKGLGSMQSTRSGKRRRTGGRSSGRSENSEFCKKRPRRRQPEQPQLPRRRRRTGRP